MPFRSLFSEILVIWNTLRENLFFLCAKYIYFSVEAKNNQYNRQFSNFTTQLSIY